MDKKPRKRRRPSLRQLIHCEMGSPITSRCRCRCGGSRRGLRRCSAVKPTRWCFAALPKDDPHYIPPPRRRISPRHAMHMLAAAKKMLELRQGNPRVQARQRRVLITAIRDVAKVVERERIHLELGRKRRWILTGKRWRWDRAARRYQELPPLQPSAFLDRCMAWIAQRYGRPRARDPEPARRGRTGWAHAGEIATAMHYKPRADRKKPLPEVEGDGVPMMLTLMQAKLECRRAECQA